MWESLSTDEHHKAILSEVIIPIFQMRKPRLREGM